MVYRVVPSPAGCVGVRSVQDSTSGQRFGIADGYIGDSGSNDDIGAVCGVEPSAVAATDISLDIVALRADCPLCNIRGQGRGAARCLDEVVAQQHGTASTRFIAAGWMLALTGVDNALLAESSNTEKPPRHQSPCGGGA